MHGSPWWRRPSSDGVRDCAVERFSKQGSGKETHTSAMRGSLHARSLHGDLPSRSGSYVRSRTSQFLENNVMVVLVLLLLFCSAASAVDVKPTTSSSLYDLCRNDSICAGRFYLESSASLYGLQLFRRLLDEHLSSMVGTSSSLETVPTISDANTSAWWWLSLPYGEILRWKSKQRIQVGIRVHSDRRKTRRRRRRSDQIHVGLCYYRHSRRGRHSRHYVLHLHRHRSAIRHALCADRLFGAIRPARSSETSSQRHKFSEIKKSSIFFFPF